jgi:PPIC-type PPIASE domain
MQRWTAVVVGAFSLVMIGALVLKGGHRSFITDASGDGGPGSPTTPESKEHRPVESGVLDDPLFAADFDLDGGLLGLLPASDAEPGAQLPSGLPKMVRFGVILVKYRGAQDAPASSRSKAEALGLARSLAEAARADFKAQVSRGDPGSMDDAGRIPRGVLEPSAEYALFTLSPGGVSDPVDTPRGYWIVKRIE